LHALAPTGLLGYTACIGEESPVVTDSGLRKLAYFLLLALIIYSVGSARGGI
jgi:hypothetical protein